MLPEGLGVRWAGSHLLELAEDSGGPLGWDHVRIEVAAKIVEEARRSARNMPGYTTRSAGIV